MLTHYLKGNMVEIPGRYVRMEYTDKPQWRDVSTKPRENSEIVFDWSGARFTGIYRGSTQPWGVAWYVEGYFFSKVLHEKTISAYQIARWAYADGSR